MRNRTYAPLAALFAVVAVLAPGCVDLDVTNPNDPDRDRVLASASDVEALVSGAFNTWYTGLHHWGNTYWLGNASFQYASHAALAGNIDHTPIPRGPLVNEVDWIDYHHLHRPWIRSYRALVAVADGLRVMESNPQIVGDLEAEDRALRLRAFARTVQALGHASLAVHYDRAPIVDESTDVVQAEPVPYATVMDTAYAYFDEAIALAETGSFTLPASWMSVEVTSDRLVGLLHAWRAVFRASLPRWDSESVDWNEVLADLDRAPTTSFVMDADPEAGWYNGAFEIAGGPNGWAHESYFVIGMADQSGDYQRWLAQPVEGRLPWFGDHQDDDPFLIRTPDTRFPTGATLDEQIADPGDYYVIPTLDGPFEYGYTEHFGRPGRGTWRWSYYYYPTSWDYWNRLDFSVAMVTPAELDLLRAEALLGTGDAEGAAALVNRYRTVHGLAATDAAGVNTDCVPRLPDGSCGGLLEMLKWEKRLEVESTGLLSVGWYWDARRWGDLYRGTPLHLPIPADDAVRIGIEPYTFGGADATPPDASPGSSYDWPGERLEPPGSSP